MMETVETFVGPPVRTSFTVQQLVKTECFKKGITAEIAHARKTDYQHQLANHDGSLEPAALELLQWRCLWWEACLIKQYNRLKNAKEKAIHQTKKALKTAQKAEAAKKVAAQPMRESVTPPKRVNKVEAPAPERSQPKTTVIIKKKRWSIT